MSYRAPFKTWKKELIQLADDLCVKDLFLKECPSIEKENGYSYYQKIIMKIYKEKWFNEKW